MDAQAICKDMLRKEQACLANGSVGPKLPGTGVMMEKEKGSGIPTGERAPVSMVQHE